MREASPCLRYAVLAALALSAVPGAAQDADEPLKLILTPALGAADQAPAEDPAVHDPHTPFEREVQAGLAARQSGQLPEAQQHFHAALALDPAQPDVLHQLAMAEAYQKQYPDALSHLDAAQALVPADVDIMLDRARVLAWSGQIPDAARLVDGVLDAHPSNGEAWDLRARLHWYQSEPAEAEAAARRALAIDPLSADFKLTLAQSLAAQGHFPAAADLAREVAPVRPGDAEVAALLQSEIDNRPRPWRIDVALSRSHFERIPLQDWQGLTLQLNRTLSASDTVYARVDNAHRFGLVDTELTAGLAHTFWPGFGGYVEAGLTPGADFFPRQRISAGAELRVRPDSAPLGATFVSLDASAARYALGTSYGLSPGVIQYLYGGKAWLSLHLNNSLDAKRHYLNGWGVRADVLPVANWNVHAGWSRAPESDTEITGGSIALVRAFSLGASWQSTPDLALRLDYLREDRTASYLRHEFVIGGSYRF